MQNDLFSLSGKTALVTGSARGLGLEIARGLAGQGAHVLVNGRDAEAVQRAVQDITQTGGHATPLVFDVADDAAMTSALAPWIEDGGVIDILVNNVGIRDRRGLFEFELDDVRRMLDVNVVAPFELSRRVARTLIAHDRPGRIINIASIAGLISASRDAAYTTAKGALVSMTRALAAELGAHGITVNCVAPGFFATERNAERVADVRVAQTLSTRTSLGRWGKPPEIAGAVAFLASDCASYVTGTVLAVDGGYVAHY